MRYRLLALLLLGALGLGACRSDDPSRKVAQGDALFSVSFDEPGAWEEGAYPVETSQPDSSLAVVDGRYRIEHHAARSSSFTWGVGGEAAENVIVEVEAAQVSEENDNLYGVLCRVQTDDSGATRGYALVISGDGHYGIATVERGALSFLLEWHQSDAIHQGQASNTIRAICVDDYLAVYANGTFLGDVTDSALREPGQVGLIAGVKRESAVTVTFDDLAVYEGEQE
jgi:hypothetical protein